jgi:hypothetical protein
MSFVHIEKEKKKQAIKQEKERKGKKERNLTGFHAK